MGCRAVVLAAALVMVPLGVHAADLVIWWDEPYYAEEGEALKEIIGTFEQDSGKQVELVLHPLEELPEIIAAALEAGHPPDFAFGLLLNSSVGQWAFDDRLIDLSDTVGHFSDLFGPEVLSWELWLNGRTGQKALYGLPMGRTSYYIHVWKSLLERAGFTLEDVPKEWDAFWGFWCDEVQPAVRKALGRDDVWGVGLSMGVGVDTQNGFLQFLAANGAAYVTRDGRLAIDDPEIRKGLIKVVDSYTAIYRKDCTPPDAVNWSTGEGNNKAFLAQTRGDDRERDALHPEHAQERAVQRLLREHGDDRMAAR